MRTLLDLTGQRFDRLVVVSEASRDRPSKSQPKGVRRWLCCCDCGKESVVRQSNLTAGHTRSCGCLHREQTTHGMSRTSVYKVWQAMFTRCYKSNCSRFKSYGGRGIRVCSRWLDPEKFSADMGPRPSPDHSLDRIDNDGDYCPENCRWTTSEEQTRNRRSNRLLTFDGRTQVLIDWAKELGISSMSLRKRLKSGWSLERALTTPGRGSKPKERA